MKHESGVLREPYDRRFTLMMAACLILWAVMTAGIVTLGSAALPPQSRGLVWAMIAIGGATTLALLVSCSLAKVCLDADGADVRNPLLGRTILRWSEIGTAAVVRIAIGAKEQPPMIILSTRAPEEVLTRRALVTKGLPRVEVIRMPWTASRQRFIEERLGMTLETFRV